MKILSSVIKGVFKRLGFSGEITVLSLFVNVSVIIFSKVSRHLCKLNSRKLYLNTNFVSLRLRTSENKIEENS